MNNIIPWDFTVIPEKFFFFAQAALYTLEITTLGILTGLVLGLIVALGKLSSNKAASGISNAYIFVIRGTPLLLQLFIIYYGLTSIVTIPPFPSAIIALGVHNGAYIAEIFRGSIQSIHYGQMEAARSLGMPQKKAMRRIILPQAFKRAVPPLGNQFIIALKDSSLASTIAVPELLLRGRQLGSSSFMYMEMLIIVAIWYLIMTSVLTFAVHRVEKRLRVSDRD
ncbi:MAG: amino acid ABC transporter permease [Spirochaetia bacterium]|nr:amino acid ABC transporter permease [Spirochaetia bacterium]MCF7952795.1 amino acid ABC transporter permease [Spirochaetales bacterium]